MSEGTLAMPGPTIHDVAQRAGVSIATVSRVQRGSAPVAGPTRQRVTEAIRALRYTPHRPAQSLAERRHAALAIVFPDLSGPYFSEVIRGFESDAADPDHGVLILSTHGRQAAADRVRELAARVDGLLVLGRTVPDQVIEELQVAGPPVVLLARPPVADAVAIRAENREAARRLTEHLLDHGHRRIAFLGDPDSSPDGDERWRGFLDAHRAAGIPQPEAPVRTPYREAEGRAAARAALSRKDPPTALFCANDEIAVGAYAAAREAGKAIGRDLAITGWDDIPLASCVAPALTTVAQPMYALGARGARALKEQIANREIVGRRAPLQIVLASQLAIRASCGCQAPKEVPE